MKAIILAAGRGNRMGDGTAELPKCLMKFNEHTLLDRLIESLNKAGFAQEDIGIVTGYRQETITVEGVHYFHNPNWDKTNMFTSLTMAEEWLQKDICCVFYADIVVSPSAIRLIMNAGSDIAITYYTGFWDLWQLRFDNPLEDLETFKMHNGKLVEIGMPPGSKSDIEGQYMGLLRFTPKGWQNIKEAITLPMPKPIDKLDMTTLLQHLITLKYDIETIPSNDLWLECDNQNDLRVYERHFGNI